MKTEYYILLILLSLVLANAIEDSFRTKNKKVLAHIYNSIHIVGWFYLMKFDFNWTYVFQYILIRFALFDITWNLIVGKPLFYIGTTSLYDKFWQWFKKTTKFPMNHFLFWVKLIALLLAVIL